jgi:prepilin-type N-terminal cleavage/methylation domain-containing protein
MKRHISNFFSPVLLHRIPDTPTSAPQEKIQTAPFHETPIKREHLNKRGFTIVELMFATMAFSVILLVLTAAVVQIGKMFYKGVISSRTQDSARTVIDDVSRPIQFSAELVKRIPPSSPTASKPAIGVVCVGTQRYTYALNAQLDTSVPVGVYKGGNGAGSDHRFRYALWVDDFAGAACTPADLTATLTDGKELLGDNARLTKFDVTPGGSLNLWRVDVGVLYGDDDLIQFSDGSNNTPVRCTGNVAGSQWCALAELTTQVNQRLIK